MTRWGRTRENLDGLSLGGGGGGGITVLGLLYWDYCIGRERVRERERVGGYLCCLLGGVEGVVLLMLYYDTRLRYSTTLLR